MAATIRAINMPLVINGQEHARMPQAPIPAIAVKLRRIGFNNLNRGDGFFMGKFLHGEMCAGVWTMRAQLPIY